MTQKLPSGGCSNLSPGREFCLAPNSRIVELLIMAAENGKRVEVALPVLDKGIRAQLRSMFRSMMQDNCQAWEQQSDGSYQQGRNAVEELNAQEYFFIKAYEIAAGRK